MTSSSASESTWRTLYGSNPSDGIRRPHADVGERDRERVGLVRGQPTEQVADDVAEGRGDRQGEDRAQQPRQRAADDDREHDGSRMELDRVALDLRHEEVVLDLLHQ